MRDYEELVEALRLCVRWNRADNALANAEQAADAIEELKEDNAALKATVTNLLEQIKGFGLSDYKDAEAEGRLIVLPCKIGDVVYYIPSYAKKVFRGSCHSISIHGAGIQINIYDADGDNVSHPPKRVFPTQAEAEKALEWANGGRGERLTGGANNEVD